MLRELREQWGRFFEFAPELILDPGAGSGAITRELRMEMLFAHLVAIEIDKGHQADLLLIADEVHIRDYLSVPPVSMPREHVVDLIFGNPPYSGPKREDLAMSFVEHSIHVAKVTCFLLRLNWLGSQRRAKFMREHPPYVCILPKRPSFIKNQPGRSRTDSCEYAWMTWGMKGLEGTWKVLEI